MFIEETFADGDIYIMGYFGCCCADFAASVQIRAEENAG